MLILVADCPSASGLRRRFTIKIRPFEETGNDETMIIPLVMKHAPMPM
jgi:hypothetical protein